MRRNSQLEPTRSTRQDPRVLEELDRWENRWFPIVDASLRFRFPDVHHALLDNLSQTSGAEVVISVGELMRRVDVLLAATDDTSKAAVALLAQRGFDADTQSQARTLLETLVVDPAPVADPTERRERLEQAERHLWQWYLEWSQIARVAIQDGRLLRQLGFRPMRSRDRSNEATSNQAAVGVDRAELLDAIDDILDGPEGDSATGTGAAASTS